MNWGGKSKNGWILRSFLAKHIVILNTDMKKIFYPKSYKTTLIYRGIDLNVNFKRGFFGGYPIKKWNTKIVKKGLDKFMKKYGLALAE